MSKADKLLARMRANPKDDWTMAHIETISQAYGLPIRARGGSHHVVKSGLTGGALSIPARRPIKARYVELFIAMIDDHVRREAEG